MLTRKQHELLIFIEHRMTDTGIAPSFDEMKDALGLKSKSGIHRLVTGLEERGFIRRLPHRARALEILRPPGGRLAQSQRTSQTDSPADRQGDNIIQADFNKKSPDMATASQMVTLPLHGRIAAGTPIEAIRDPSGEVQVPAALISTGEYYALEVAGDSMIEAGILDGDMVIIDTNKTANEGDIVVALVDKEEATLKRLRLQGDTIALEPANSAYETQHFGAERVTIQGRLTALLRRY